MGVSSAALLASPWGPAQSRAELQRLTVYLHDPFHMGHLPLQVVQRLGYLEQSGIKLNLVAQPPHEPVAPERGAYSLFSGPFEQVYLLHSLGQPSRAFAQLCQAPQVVIGVAPQLASTVRSLPDLSRHSVGVSGEDSLAHRVALLAFRRAGVLPESVQWHVFPSGAELIQAFRAGKIDAISHDGLDVTLLEQQGAIKLLTDTRRTKDTEFVYEGPVPAICLAATSEFITANPQTCQVLTEAVQRALRWLQTAGPVDLVKTLPPQLMRGDRAVYLAAFNKMRHAFGRDAVIPDSGPFSVFKALVRLRSESLPQRIDIASTFTNEFALRAKARHGGA